MKATAINSVEADNKVAAFYKSKLLNAVNATGYSTKQKTRAERMLYALQLVYGYSNSYINYRKGFIAVKFENPKIKDRKTLSLLESDYAAEGIEKVVSGQGVIYRIGKEV